LRVVTNTSWIAIIILTITISMSQAGTLPIITTDFLSPHADIHEDGEDESSDEFPLDADETAAMLQIIKQDELTAAANTNTNTNLAAAATETATSEAHRSSFFSALDTSINPARLTRPFAANPSHAHICPVCNSPVTLRSGKVRRPHFAHHASSNCNFYSSNGQPGESAEHIYAKQLLKSYLESRRHSLSIEYTCTLQSSDRPPYCHGSDGEYFGDRLKLSHGDTVVEEYTDPGTKWGRADLAVLGPDGRRKVLIEVFHTHQTIAYRPEPWYEVSAREVIEQQDSPKMRLEEKREGHTRLCECCLRAREPWTNKIPRLRNAQGNKGKWLQEGECLGGCGRRSYSAIWLAGAPRQMCKICFGGNFDQIKARYDH